MENKMSLHIVWPFVILWIIVSAMAGGDLIPLHLTDEMGGVGKVAYLLEQVEPVDDVAQIPVVDNVNQTPVVDNVDQTPVTDNSDNLNPIVQDIVQDSIVTDPTQTTIDETSQVVGIPEEQLSEITYILNTNSMKFHNLDCHSAELIAPQNFKESFDNRDTIVANGYSPCKNCNP